MSDIAISSRSCTERHGDFSESVVFHSSYEVSCFLFVFWLGCLVFVFVVCLCWLLLGCWMGDTFGFVSLYSHAWEWTISTKRLMTVRASSAHGTGKKKNFHGAFKGICPVGAILSGQNVLSRAIFRHQNFKKCSASTLFCFDIIDFRMCFSRNFSTSEPQKAPTLTCFAHFDFTFCHQRAIFRDLFHVGVPYLPRWPLFRMERLKFSII